MRFVARIDGGGPDDTTVLDAYGFREAMAQVVAWRPKLQRVDLRLVSEASAGGGSARPSLWRRIVAFIRGNA